MCLPEIHTSSQPSPPACFIGIISWYWVNIIISQSHISKISTKCWRDRDWDPYTVHFGHLFLFLLSKISISTLEKYEFLISLSTLESRDQNFKFLFLLSKFEIGISNFSFSSRNSRSESQISLSTLEIRDQNFKFLFLLSKFEIRILNFSFYSRIYFFDSRQCLVHALISRFRENAQAAKKFSRSIELARGLIGTKLSGLVDAGFAMEFASKTCSGALVVLVCPW